MADPKSTEDTESTQKSKSAAPAAAPLPEGHIAVSQSEFDGNQAELRRLRKKDHDRSQADTDAESRRLQEAQVVAGNTDAAIQTADARAEAAEARAANAEISVQLSDIIAAKGYSGEKGTALKGLVDVAAIPRGGDGLPEAGGLDAAVDSVTTRYSSLFKKDTTASEEDSNPSTTRKAVAPATPLDDGVQSGDYMTPEEYTETPLAVRLTTEFQGRARRSEHKWPKVVKASTFAQGN